MDDARLAVLCDEPPDEDGRYVLYWMQQSQRAVCNPALEYAISAAAERDAGVIVGFGLTADYPDANRRHFAFMLQGLAGVRSRLSERDIKFVVRRGDPAEVALELSGDASLVVCDRGYLRHQRRWRDLVARRASKRVVQIEGDVVVPVETASDKAEYAARTIRPKIARHRDRFLSLPTERKVAKSTLPLDVKGDVDLRRWGKALDGLGLDSSGPGPVALEGGYDAASRRLTRFIRSHLEGYADDRNDFSEQRTSLMSPYLHFGQISPVEIACKIRDAKSGRAKDREAYLEELIVRRELAMNHVFYRDDYDRYSSIPDWARESLDAHVDDERPQRYSRSELEAADTQDAAWNAAMNEAKKTGFMHNYMRMYWGKKILEWSNTREYAFRTLLYLMNKYFLDGRDPNSYAGIGWIFGLHDRAWQERDVFGKVRSMTAGGLERKFDVDAYVDRVAKIDDHG